MKLIRLRLQNAEAQDKLHKLRGREAACFHALCEGFATQDHAGARQATFTANPIASRRAAAPAEHFYATARLNERQRRASWSKSRSLPPGTRTARSPST